MCFQKFRFKLIHGNARIWWCKLSSDSRSWTLLFNFSIKFKVIILEHKFSQLNKIFSRDLLWLSFFRASSSAFKPSLCGILGYSPTTSAVTSIEFSGRFTISLIFLRKSPESLCMTNYFAWPVSNGGLRNGMALSQSYFSELLHIYIYIYMYFIYVYISLRKKCPYSELFWSVFPAFGLNPERYGEFSPNAGKYGPE